MSEQPTRARRRVQRRRKSQTWKRWLLLVAAVMIALLFIALLVNAEGGGTFSCNPQIGTEHPADSNTLAESDTVSNPERAT